MLAELLAHRVVVCVGNGGVGKTSVASALSVVAARHGLRVLALTVDPAGRLADSMGVDRNAHGPQALSADRLELLSISQGGALQVAILDAQRTLEEMVRAMAPDASARAGIVGHPLFRYLSEYLSGANEVLAMERLLQALDSTDVDLIVLDTPPTRHALDFLRGPERLDEAMRGPVLKALVRAVDGSKRLHLDWVGQRLTKVFGAFAKLSGSETLEQVATLLWELRGIFGGLGEHAERLASAFRDPSFGYVMVTRPATAALEDASAFARVLRERSLALRALVVNRVHDVLPEAEVQRGLPLLPSALDPALATHVEQAVRQHQRLVAREQARIREALAGPWLSGTQHWQLPAVAGGVRNIADLSFLSDRLERAASAGPRT